MKPLGGDHKRRAWSLGFIAFGLGSVALLALGLWQFRAFPDGIGGSVTVVAGMAGATVAAFLGLRHAKRPLTRVACGLAAVVSLVITLCLGSYVHAMWPYFHGSIEAKRGNLVGAIGYFEEMRTRLAGADSRPKWRTYVLTASGLARDVRPDMYRCLGDAVILRGAEREARQQYERGLLEADRLGDANARRAIEVRLAAMEGGQ